MSLINVYPVTYRGLATHIILFCQRSITNVVGKGNINQVCVVETESRKVVIRMNDQDTFPSFVKEKWCIEQAAAVGIPGPEVLSAWYS